MRCRNSWQRQVSSHHFTDGAIVRMQLVSPCLLVWIILLLGKFENHTKNGNSCDFNLLDTKAFRISLLRLILDASPHSIYHHCAIHSGEKGNAATTSATSSFEGYSPKIFPCEGNQGCTDNLPLWPLAKLQQWGSVFTLEGADPTVWSLKEGWGMGFRCIDDFNSDVALLHLWPYASGTFRQSAW